MPNKETSKSLFLFLLEFPSFVWDGNVLPVPAKASSCSSGRGGAAGTAVPTVHLHKDSQDTPPRGHFLGCSKRPRGSSRSAGQGLRSPLLGPRVILGSRGGAGPLPSGLRPGRVHGSVVSCMISSAGTLTELRCPQKNAAPAQEGPRSRSRRTSFVCRFTSSGGSVVRFRLTPVVPAMPARTRCVSL